MKGRIEHKISIEDSLKGKIKAYPSWVGGYYYSLTNYTHNTKKTYIEKVCGFLDWYFMEHGSVRSNTFIREISSIDINEYIDSKKCQLVNGEEISKEAIALIISSLNSFFSYLLLQGYIDSNPMDRATKRPISSTEKEIIYLEEEEITLLLHNVEHGVGNQRARSIQKKWRNRDRLLILLPLITGMRVSALDEINIEDIDFTKKEVSVIEKREKPRTFQLDDEMCHLIKLWLDDREKILKGNDTQALFISETRGEISRLTVRSIERIVKKYCQGIEKAITPHKLRSTFGTQYYRQTGDIYLTAQMMGHKSTKTTSRYVAVDNAKKMNENKMFSANMLSKIDLPGLL